MYLSLCGPLGYTLVDGMVWMKQNGASENDRIFIFESNNTLKKDKYIHFSGLNTSTKKTLRPVS